MKRIVFYLLFSFLAISVNAQKHLAFMGFPLDGSITAFQQKLATKNVIPDDVVNDGTIPGALFYKGTFSSDNAQIIVYFNPTTKNVYRAKACIMSTVESQILKKLGEYKEMLIEKYSPSFTENNEQDGYPSYTIPIFIKEVEEDEKSLIGTISLYISKLYQVHGNYQYTLHLDYTDVINIIKNEEERKIDL